MNKKKSAIMIVRKDKRTRPPKHSSILQLPIVSEYKYLGMLVDDSASLKPQAAQLRNKIKQFKFQLSLQWAN